jgi:hypothetical protein
MPSTVVYAAPEELRRQSDMTSVQKDDVLELMLSAASRSIDNVCNRPDGFQALSAAATRLYTGSGGAVQLIDETVSVSLVETKGSPQEATWEAWTSADWLLASGDPRIPRFGRTPYTLLLIDPSGDQTRFHGGRSRNTTGFRPIEEEIRAYGVPTLRVTGRWGYALTPPDTIRQATIIQAARWLKRGESAWADSIGDSETGQVMFKKSLDPDIVLLLKQGRFIRPSLGLM